jgi:DUF1680 family protein
MERSSIFVYGEDRKFNDYNERVNTKLSAAQQDNVGANMAEYGAPLEIYDPTNPDADWRYVNCCCPVK